MAASQSSEYFWRARETCGTVGTMDSSFLTSSNGSKMTPVNVRLSDSGKQAEMTSLWELFADEDDRRTEAVEKLTEFGETEEVLVVSPLLARREKAGEALTSIVVDVDLLNNGRGMKKEKTVNVMREKQEIG